MRVVILAVLLLLAAAVPAARADRIVMPDSRTTAHVVVHFDPAVTPAAEAQTVAADAEEAYSRLVIGAGGVPNAGLRAPVNDGDARVDYYISLHPDLPDFRGGLTERDPSGACGSFVWLTPGMSRTGQRFRAAHELMHVIQGAYRRTACSAVGMIWDESTANWAVEWSLPDMNPLDNNFSSSPLATTPWLPLDCISAWPATGAGQPCGGGYWQWLFFERQVEDYGPDVVTGLYERWRACVSPCFTHAVDVAMLADELTAQGGPTATLSSRYERYAWQVWDPAAWTTAAVGAMHADPNIGHPAATIRTRSSLAAGTVAGTATVDHLASRYVLVRNAADGAPSGPQDTVTFSMTRPAGLPSAWTYLTRAKGSSAWIAHAAGLSGAVPFDPGADRELLVPLTNPSATLDGASLGYDLRLVRGPSAAPANDLRSGAQPVRLGVAGETDTVYASGWSSEEAEGCPLSTSGGVVNGVWFRFTAPSWGTYRFETSASAFAALTALFDQAGGAFQTCATDGVVVTHLGAGQTRDIYVGRLATDRGDGTVARLLVSGPGTSTAPNRVTLANGATLRPDRRGRLTLRLRCSSPSGQGCKGSLELRTAAKVRRGRRLATLRLASGRFLIRPKGTATVRVTLTRDARRLLAKRRHVAVVVGLSVVGPDVKTRRSTLRRTLRAAR